MKTYKPAFIIFLFAVTIFYPLYGQPDISIDPDSLYSDLITGETETHTVTITNNGEDDLDWEMEIDWITLESVTFTKDNYADWSLPQNQDRVSDNIWITRGNEGAIFNAYSESSDEHPHNPEGTEWAIGSLEDIDNLTFGDFGIVLSHDVGNVLNGNLIPNNLPMVMHLIDDDIYYEVQFLSWTQGNEAGGGGFSYTRSGEYDAIYMSPESGTVSADSSSDVDIIFDASGMFGGEYYADIIIASNDPVDPTVVIPAHLSVTGAADIWVDPDTVDFGVIYVNYAGPGNYGGTLELTLGNDGSDALNVSSITVDNTAFTVSQSSAYIEYGEEIILDVTFTTADVGTDSGTITVQSDDPNEGTVTIPVYANAVEPPVIAVSPGSLFADLNTGETETHTVTITNNGASDLDWEMEIDWITWESVTFTKNNYADWQVPQNQDRVSDNIWITRGDAGALFNAYNESYGWHPHGPDGTEWAIGSLENIDNLTFDSFALALDHNIGSVLNGVLIPNNLPMVMHLIDDDIYYEVQFISWTQGNEVGGGGFSYTRTREYDAIYMSPESGTVSASSSSDVDIIFDASGMFGGDYYADIIIASNDPVNPPVVVPAHLSVTGAADIWVDPDTVDFGEIYVNYAGPGNYGGTLELTLGNDGSDVLNVSSITVDNTAFTVSQSEANIEYGEKIILDVTFTTADVGTDSGTITVQSDDLDEGTVTIPVYANAVEPPVIDVSGFQTVSLNEGDTLDQVVTVTNNGANDLIYEIDLYEQPQQQRRRPGTSQVNSRNKPILFKGNFDIWESETRQNLHRSLQKLNNTVSNDDSEIANARHSRDASRSWQFLYHDENETGLTIDVADVYGDANDEELLIKWDSYVGWTNTSGIGLTHIFVDADQDPNTGQPMWLMVPTWNIGAEYLIQRFHDNWGRVLELVWDDYYNDWVGYDIDTLTTNSVEPYGNEVIIGVDASHFEGYNGINFGFVADNLNEPNVDLAPSFDSSPFITFNFSPGWLSVDPQTGVVPAGSSQDIIATYNATGMLGGDYFADVIFYSNDPVDPEYTAPAHMSVTGIPDIYVQDEVVDFGISYVGYSNEAFLTLENTGTGMLEVQNITTDSENLTVAVTSFEIDPLQSESIQLFLTGTDAGAFSANVTIESNDPDEPTITLPVTSTMLIAPDISTTPEIFDLTVLPGETISDTLTIANVGGSDLDFNGEVSFTIRDVTDISFEITIITDYYPGETSWNLSTSAGQTIASIAEGSLTGGTTFYSWEYELQPDDYVFTIYDAWGDGICCGYGQGEYNLYLDDELIASGGSFGQSETVEFSIENDAWLTMDPVSGMVPSDGSTDITLTVDVSTLELGDHSADIYITSNDPDEGTVIIPLSLSVTTDMGSHDEALFPKEFALHQNYPNPFNPMTSIRYDLPKNENVKIIIYDMLGRQVRQLVNSYQEAGFKSIIWDATNDFGRPAAAGVYLYKIQAGDFIQTKKMVLLK